MTGRPLVEQADERAQQPGLALAALAEQHDVVAREQGPLQLGQHGGLEADDARPRVASRPQRGDQVVADLVLDATLARGRTRAARPGCWEDREAPHPRYARTGAAACRSGRDHAGWRCGRASSRPPGSRPARRRAGRRDRTRRASEPAHGPRSRAPEVAALAAGAVAPSTTRWRHTGSTGRAVAVTTSLRSGPRVGSPTVLSAPPSIARTVGTVSDVVGRAMRQPPAGARPETARSPPMATSTPQPGRLGHRLGAALDRDRRQRRSRVEVEGATAAAAGLQPVEGGQAVVDDAVGRGGGDAVGEAARRRRRLRRDRGADAAWTAVGRRGPAR